MMIQQLRVSSNDNKLIILNAAYEFCEHWFVSKQIQNLFWKWFLTIHQDVSKQIYSKNFWFLKFN